MAVIVANLYQQAAMCTTDKHRAPRWLNTFALVYMPKILHMEDKVKAVLSQKVRTKNIIDVVSRLSKVNFLLFISLLDQV